jgi:hypothetical protein
MLKHLCLIACLTVATVAAVAYGDAPTNTVIFTTDLVDKEVGVDDVLAVRETIPIWVVGIGASHPTNLTLYLQNDTTQTVALISGFTAPAGTTDIAAATLDLNTEELVAEFEGKRALYHKTFDIGIWDSVLERLLVNDRVYIQNNPYEDGMPEPTPVTNQYLTAVSTAALIASELADYYNKTETDTLLDEKLSLDGSDTMAGSLKMGTNAITQAQYVEFSTRDEIEPWTPNRLLGLKYSYWNGMDWDSYLVPKDADTDGKLYGRKNGGWEEVVGGAEAETQTLQDVVTQGGAVTSGVVTIDAANARTNTYGGALTVLGARVKANRGTASGTYSFASGVDTVASGSASVASGERSTASGQQSQAHGYYAQATNDQSWVWQGLTSGYYGSKGMGSFCINPYNGTSGFYIGSYSLASLLAACVPNARTVTINGDTQTLSSNLVWTISTGGAHEVAEYHVTPSTNAATAGSNLATTYAAAEAASPTASNRAVVICSPGVYEMASTLAWDTEYVDLVSLTSERDVFLTGSNVQFTADHIHISGIDVTGSDQGYLYMGDAKTNQVWRNVKGGDWTYDPAWWFGKEFAGSLYDSAIGDDFGRSGTVSGTVSDNTIGDDFGLFGTVSGTVSDNIIGDDFGHGGTVSGTVSDNTIGDSFGGYGMISGTILRNSFTGSYEPPTGAGKYIDCIDSSGELFSDSAVHDYRLADIRVANATEADQPAAYGQLDEMAFEDWPASDGEEYVAKNGAWAVKTDSDATDHTALSNLAITSSGHTGTATRLWGADGSGAASEIDYSGWDTDASDDVSLGTVTNIVTAAIAIQQTPIELTSATTVTVSETSGPLYRLDLATNATIVTSGVDTNKTAGWRLDVRLNAYTLTLSTNHFVDNLGTITATNSYFSIFGNRPYRATITEAW